MQITFETEALHQVFIDESIAFKALSELKQDIATGRQRDTPGPDNLTKNGIGVKAKHFHLTNRIGMAYNITGTNIHILAIGVKHNRNKGQGDSGYDWDKKGNISFA